jgi:hypothetical protein
MPHRARTMSGSSGKNRVSCTDTIRDAVQTNQETPVSSTRKAHSENRSIPPDSFDDGGTAYSDRDPAERIYETRRGDAT